MIRHLQVSQKTFSRLALAAAVAYALLVLTGGAVRLTGSGLGCSDWPTCSAGHVTATLSFHPLVEFSNRCVSVAVTLFTAVTFLVAVFAKVRRRDLVWLSGGLVLGLLGQIVLGGLVVLTKLNPYLVAAHFLLTIAILVDALVLYHLSKEPATPAIQQVGREILWLSRLLLGALGLVTLLGTMVTGAGPHAGGPGAKRVPVSFQTIAELHADVVLFLIGLTLATLFALHQAKAPAIVQRRARLFLEMLAIQGVLGYTQYFLHDAAGVVELHLAGATTAWIVAVTYYLSLHRHPPIVADVGLSEARLTPATAGTT